uniref:Uncharacterized protein n=1 Tax=Xanthomonas campestris pv. phaseoli TaxID=317013 RepID=Q9WWH2_XANCH|nr:unknown [Xanthomonas phaseoli pv. phaseoli]
MRCNRQLTRSQASLLPLAGEGGAQRRMREDTVASVALVAPVLVASRRARPHPPFGHLPPQAGGREQVVVGCSEIDRCSATDRSRAARNRFSRWRETVARSAGCGETPFAPVAPVVVASRRSHPHPPFGHLPPQAGEGSLVSREGRLVSGGGNGDSEFASAPTRSGALQ